MKKTIYKNHTKKRSLVLLVDDEPDIVNLYSVVLQREGFVVITAKNGTIGFLLAKEKKPDLILLDLKMPVMDGVEALVKLKEDPATKDIKVVFLTAFGDPKHEIEIDAKYAKEVGAVDFLKKGMELGVFLQELRKYLE